MSTSESSKTGDKDDSSSKSSDKKADNTPKETSPPKSTTVHKETTTKKETKPPKATTPKPEIQISDYQIEVFNLVNEERKKAGLKPYKLDDTLTAAAQMRAIEIVTVFDHKRPDGSDFVTAIKQFGGSYKEAGENIAAGKPTPKQVVAQWMASPKHKTNILSKDFKKIGIGYVKYDGGYTHYWTQIFAS